MPPSKDTLVGGMFSEILVGGQKGEIQCFVAV